MEVASRGPLVHPPTTAEAALAQPSAMFLGNRRSVACANNNSEPNRSGKHAAITLPALTIARVLPIMYACGSMASWMYLIAADITTLHISSATEFLLLTFMRRQWCHSTSVDSITSRGQKNGGPVRSRSDASLASSSDAHFTKQKRSILPRLRHCTSSLRPSAQFLIHDSTASALMLACFHGTDGDP